MKRVRSSWPFGRLATLLLVAFFGATGAIGVAQVGGGESPLDPTRGLALPCDILPVPGTPGRAERNIKHQAYRCGIVGTDIEFQSRATSDGKEHDYAFVGSVGNGLRIFDITDPKNPVLAGNTNSLGYQNDVQVRGDYAFMSYDGASGEPSNLSTCLQTRYPEADGQGVDVFHLKFNAGTGKFDIDLDTCIPNPPGGAHTHTIHPSGNFLFISNSSSDWAVDVVDLRGELKPGGTPKHMYRVIDESRASMDGRCPATATFRCIVVRRPDGSSTRANGVGTCTSSPDVNTKIDCFRPHDLFFSPDGSTMYVAALNSTFIMDASNLTQPGQTSVRTLAIIPNVSEQSPPAPVSRNIFLSHQADVTPDGKILVITDERGGGVQETSCQQPGQRIIGAMHFWALAPVDGAPQSAGASPTSPKKLGSYVNPTPLPNDPLEGRVRAERGCTVHVLRIGGNSGQSAGDPPGPDGASSLTNRQLVTAWYGAGIWYIDFSSPPDSQPGDDVREDGQTSWGNTLGWNIQAGADTWSAKEYKGDIFTGDLARGFDSYSFNARAVTAQQQTAGACASRTRSRRARIRRGRATVTVTVKRGRRAVRSARVTVRGPGIRATKRTSRSGRVSFKVRARSTGALRASTTACAARLAARVRQAQAPRFTG